MGPDRFVMGVFNSEDRTAAAIKALRKSPFTVERVNSPIPSHTISAALELKKSRVGYFTLAGGIFGFFAGFALALFTAMRWELIVSGKPIAALIPFFIVGFEFVILFAVFGNIIGFIVQTGLPNFKGLERYDPRCSGEHFGILASCRPDEQDSLRHFFHENGGEVVDVHE